MPLFDRPDGALHYESAGEGEPVVFLPGLGFDGGAWGYQTAALKGDCLAIALDNRGSGHSFAPESGYSLPEMARDVVDLLDHLEIATASLVGMSLGGMIAQTVAAEYGNRVNRLALVTCAARIDPAAAAVFDDLERCARDEDIQQAMEHLFDACYSPEFLAGQRALAAALRQRIAQSLPPAAGFFGQLSTVRTCHTLELLPRIQVPTLVIGAKEDRILPCVLSEELAAGLPHAKLQTVSAGHGCCVEAADDVNVALADFLFEE